MNETDLEIIVPVFLSEPFRIFFAGIAPYSLGLSATSQQYFSLRTNQPPDFSLKTNQHQPSTTSQTNRPSASVEG
jgi:hypothetical protein